MESLPKPDRRGLTSFLRSHPHPGGIIVSERYRFIYMKPCRTGGTTILRRKLEHLPLETFHLKDQEGRFRDWLENLDDDQLKNYRIFAFVRNPWDRAVSIAAYFKLPLHRFVHEFQSLTARIPVLAQHALPLHYYTHCHGRPFVDWIGKFERLQEDFDSICRQLNIPAGERLSICNRSNHLPYPLCYDFETQSKIRIIYGEDIDYFRYDFDRMPLTG